MQGRRNGVVAKILNRTAIPVHCFAHSFNLCLECAGKSLICLRDVIDTVREITNLICSSPTYSHLRMNKRFCCEIETTMSNEMDSSNWSD